MGCSFFFTNGFNEEIFVSLLNESKKETEGGCHIINSVIQNNYIIMNCNPISNRFNQISDLYYIYTYLYYFII